MGLKRCTKDLLNSILKRYGYEIIASSLLYDWQKLQQPSYGKSQLPEGADAYLQPNHPRLMELQERYALFNHKVTTPLVWTDNRVKPDDIKYFRGDNAYVWQLRGRNINILNYALATYYVKTIDNLGLLEKLEEDDYFGIFTFNIDKKIVSRDLLDSIVEIYFLEKQLNISTWDRLTILDIGAGYGRLAHRMINALPNIHTFFCTDAVAISTFISEYYLRFRGLQNKAKVIPLYNIESTLNHQRVDIAVNIHSFSECTISAIEWWLTLLEKSKIKYLMIVPNSPEYSGERLLTNDRRDFSRVVEKHGYKLIAEEPKYRSLAVQEYGINPAYHYLFELR